MLTIGTVVDDAIVVVEAVQSKFDVGYKSSYLATKDAMGDVTMAIISCTCVFMAVFIPVTFTGLPGIFYTQFGITMATSVGISMISALTLCPALCAIMMRRTELKVQEYQADECVLPIMLRLMPYWENIRKEFFSLSAIGGWYGLHFITTVLLVYFMGTTKAGLSARAK